MRRLGYHFLAAIPFLTLPPALAIGCFDAVNDCERNPNLPCYVEAGGGSSGTGLSEKCDPLKNGGASVDASCGVFVDPSASSGGDGSQASPYPTIAAAQASSPTKPIYVCATGGELSEAVMLTQTATLIGGVRCDTWAAAGARTPWTALQNEIPLVLSATMEARVQGFEIVAKPGEGSDPVTRQGASSIAVVADHAQATFIDVGMTAGTGATGESGETFPQAAPGGTAAFTGNQGEGCNADGAGGAEKPSPMCPAGDSTSVGGKGGSASATSGEPGDAGEVDPDPELMPNGTGGPAAPSGACGNGEAGQAGSNGGPGLAGMSALTLSASGYTGDAGKPGEPGQPGQGGGGGAGRLGNVACSFGVPGHGGGGGGVGGCGGRGGGGGGAGGASIALISLESSLTLTDVVLTAAVGGDGGIGGDLQAGGAAGPGGAGGMGNASACDGGPGGAGGNGGPGGGGAGGPSLGIAYTGLMPGIEKTTIAVAAAASKGGFGGNGNIASNKGADGLFAPTQGF